MTADALHYDVHLCVGAEYHYHVGAFHPGRRADNLCTVAGETEGIGAPSPPSFFYLGELRREVRQGLDMPFLAGNLFA